MLVKGGYVSYGANGICLVEDLRQMQFDSRQGPRPYYVLRPVHHQEGCVFVPADNARFQEILSRRDGRELLQLASCLRRRKAACPNGLSYSDDQVLRKAESIITEALAFSLQMNAQSVSDYIRQKLEPETDT